MNKIARKWDDSKREYEEYLLPEGASLYEDDMNKIVSCAWCGKKLPYGETYCSRKIHGRFGFGYSVCEKCYYENDWSDDNE